MALTESLRILITANGAQAEREFTKVGAAAKKGLGQADTATEQWGRRLTSAGVAMAAFGGIALVGLFKAAQAAEEEQLAIEKLNNSIANSPELAGASADAFLDQAAALQDVTTFTDDATIAAQAMLGTFHLTQEEILGLTPLVQDLAAKFNLDLNQASILVGKAMDGNAGALKRMGVRIDETAFATDRYGATMTALRENAGGFAEQEGATFNGQLQIMKNNLGDVAEGIGRGAVTAFNDLLGPVMAVSDAFQSLSPETQSTIGRISTFGAVGLTAAGGISFLAGQVLMAASRFKDLKTAMSGANAAAIAGVGPWAGLAALLIGIQTGAIDLTGALTLDEQAAAAVDDMTAAMVEAGSASEGLVDHLSDTSEFDPSFFSALGTDVDEFATALLGGEDAWDEFVSRVTGNLPEGADIGQWNDALDEHRERALASADAMGVQGEASRRAALGLDENATSAEELAASYGVLSDAVDEYLGRIQSTEEANAAEAEAQRALFDALVANGNTFDVNTQKGRDNIAARNTWVDTVGAQVQAAYDFAAAGGNEEVAQRRASNAIRDGIGDLRAARDASLITAEQFRNLAGDIRGIPNNVPIHIDSNVAFVRREFQLLAGDIANAGAVAAGHSADFHGVAPNTAEGGIVTGRQVRTVGEAGPEAIIPLNGPGGSGMEGMMERAMARALARTVTPVAVVG